MEKKKIILDTDIGSDIDDAICLAYLLKQPLCELVGITTVSGKPKVRAMIADSICKVAGVDIPIYVGIEAPLLVEPRQPGVRQEEGLLKWDHRNEYPNIPAVEFMRETIRENPGEISLLAIGPMSNVGILFAVDPEIPSLLKELVLMCGTFSRSASSPKDVEWNSFCDPHASAMTYNVKIENHISYGLDVTTKLFMNKNEVFESFKSKILEPVLDYSLPWFRQRDIVTFHDPLAAVCMFEPDICTYAIGDVKVETQSNILSGYTSFTVNPEGTHKVAKTVDAKRFYDHFFCMVNS